MTPVPHTFTDQLGRSITLTGIPQRIISIVPSQTEFLFDIGAASQICGVTKFCVHPSLARKNSIIVGGTKTLHTEKIQELQPDLIIANKEENDKESILKLSRYYPVWISDVSDLQSATDMMHHLGKITGHLQKAMQITRGINQEFLRLKTVRPRSVLYLIWRKPYMVAGKDTFIHHMITRMGFINAARAELRYPEISAQVMKKMNPDLLLLSSEPYPFKEKHIREFRSILPDVDIRMVDGEKFSWYGSHLLKVPAYFNAMDLCDSKTGKRKVFPEMWV